MTTGGSKASQLGIIRTHRASYVSGRSGRKRVRDHLLFEVLPLAAAAVLAYFRVKLPAPASGALIAVAAFLSVFLYTVMVSLWSRAGDLADSAPVPSQELTKQTKDLEELAANSAYAALVCVLAAGVFVVAAIGHRWVLIVSTAIGLGLAVHLLLVLLMVMKRVFVQTQASLLRASTGAGRSDRSPRRRASPPAA